MVTVMAVAMHLCDAPSFGPTVMLDRGDCVLLVGDSCESVALEEASWGAAAAGVGVPTGSAV